jgi:hypothetical protein
MKRLGKKRARPFVGAVAKRFNNIDKFRRRFPNSAVVFIGRRLLPAPLNGLDTPYLYIEAPKRQEEARRKNRRRVAKTRAPKRKTAIFLKPDKKRPRPRFSFQARTRAQRCATAKVGSSSTLF